MIDHAVYSEEAGSFISSKFQHLAEILHDYDSTLEMRWIPPRARSADDSKPYCIVHQLPGKAPYVVKYFSDLDNPEQILADIFVGDNNNGNVLSRLDKMNAAAEAFRLKEKMEADMESADMFHYLFNRAPNYVRWRDRTTGEIVKLDSNRRRV